MVPHSHGKAPPWRCSPLQPRRGQAKEVLPLQVSDSLLLVYTLRVGVNKYRWRWLQHDLRSCRSRCRAPRLASRLSHTGLGSKKFLALITTRRWGGILQLPRQLWVHSRPTIRWHYMHTPTVHRRYGTAQCSTIRYGTVRYTIVGTVYMVCT